MILFACSGPNAPAFIARSIEIGYLHALAISSLLVASLLLSLIVTGRWLPSIALSVLLILHPAWTVSAVHGDCGYFKRDASLAVTILGCCLVALQCGLVIRSHLNSSSGLRFSLRALLIATALVAALLGLVVYAVKQPATGCTKTLPPAHKVTPICDLLCKADLIDHRQVF
jgi:hypothetical protein